MSRSKAKATVEAGMRSFDHRLPDSVSRGRAAGAGRRSSTPIRRCTASWCSCRCRSRSTPRRCSTRSIRGKDVDGFHPVNAGRLATGLPALAPCTPLGCVMLAKTVHPSLAGLEAVVVGRSNIVGKPLAQLLLAENATVTVAHSKTRDLPAVVPPRRSAVRGGRPAGDGARRLDQAGRDRDRRRHQPRAGRGRQDAASSATSPSPKRARSRARSRRCRAASGR